MDHQHAIATGAAERYVLGQMPEDESTAYERHFFECPACSAEVENAVQFAENARAIGTSEVRPARPPSPGAIPWWDRLGLRWAEPRFAAAVAVAVFMTGVTAYLAAVRLPSLQRQLSAQAQPRPLLAFTVKSAIRGDDNSITIPEDAEVFALQMDLPEPPLPRYRCQIESSTGGSTLSVESDAPAPGRLLNLLIPSAALPPGAYTLRVAGDSNAAASQPVAVFRFVLKKGSSAP